MSFPGLAAEPGLETQGSCILVHWSSLNGLLRVAEKATHLVISHPTPAFMNSVGYTYHSMCPLPAFSQNPGLISNLPGGYQMSI